MSINVGFHMARQHGLVLRRQALAAGLSAEQVGAAVRSGAWVAVRRGVYTTGSLWDSLDPYVGRPRLEVWAATLTTRSPHLVSHDSAAYLHGLPILEAAPRLVHVTRVGHLGGRTKPSATYGVKRGICHHQAPVRTEQIVFVDDHPVLDVPRTVADIGRQHGLRHAIVAVNSALRRGWTKPALRDPVADMRSWPNVTVPRLAIEWGDSRCESVGEDLTLLLLMQLGVGVVQPQFGLQADGRAAFVDFRVGRHFVEFDGRGKYRRAQDGGHADRPAEEVMWKEKRRQDWLCGFGAGMSRVTMHDVQPDSWATTQARVLREILATNARFGTEIDDWAPYVVRRRRRL